MKKVCHISSVHDVLDVRIFWKECITLAKAGYEVIYLCEGTISMRHSGVRIIGLPNLEKGRYNRMIRFASDLCKRALELKADIYHLHDPELLRFVSLLKTNGAKVIYDAHEELPEQVKHKEWVPWVIKSPLALLIKRFESKSLRKVSHAICVSPLTLDRYTKYAVPTTMICNFPMLSEFNFNEGNTIRTNSLVYIGGLFRSRGLFGMMRLAAKVNCTLHLAGKFEDESTFNQAQSMIEWKNVVFHGMLDRKSITELLSTCKIGLLLLHPHRSFQNAYPVKLFEYMAAGLPVLCSDFPLWEKMIEQDEFGESCNPFDIEGMHSIVTNLFTNSERWSRYSQNGRKAIIEKYNWDSESAQLLHIYSSLQ